jgi:hypothetical protein
MAFRPSRQTGLSAVWVIPPFTLQKYAHVLTGQQREVVERIANLIDS